MNCPKCNAELEEGVKFCSECGTKIPAQRKTNGAGVSIGDKNVIAGDVSITNVNAQDETKLVNECHVCGKHVTNDQGHTCPECGQFTCNQCFNKKQKMCDSCVKEMHKNALNKYQALASKIYAKGAISIEDRSTLETKAESLGLSNEEVIAVENEYKKDSIGLTDADKIELEQCQKDLLEGNYNETEKIEAIYNEHSDNPDVLACYIRSIARSDDYDNDEVEKWIKQLEYDNKAAQMTLVELALIKEDLSTANKLIEDAKKKWPFDYLVSCYEIILYCFFVNKKQRFEYLPKIHDVLNSLEKPANIFEKSCGKFVQFLSDWILKWKNGEEDDSVDVFLNPILGDLHICESDDYFDKYWGKLWVLDHSSEYKSRKKKTKDAEEEREIAEKYASALKKANITFSKFTDDRDSEEYETINIGKQTWMLTPLRYVEKSGLCSIGQGVDDNQDWNSEFFGQNTYTWAAMTKQKTNKVSLPLKSQIINGIFLTLPFAIVGVILSFFSDFDSVWDFVFYFLISAAFIALFLYLLADANAVLGKDDENVEIELSKVEGVLKFSYFVSPIPIVLVAFIFSGNFGLIWTIGSILLAIVASFDSNTRFSKLFNQSKTTIAPEGWRIPSKDDVDKLYAFMHKYDGLTGALSSELKDFNNFWLSDYIPLSPDYIFTYCKYGYRSIKKLRNNSNNVDRKYRIFCIKK